MEKSGGKTAFLLKKIHSISGVVPLGFFLLEHIWTNAHIINDNISFELAVATLQNMPLLLFLEICFIWIPILYHGTYGMYIVFTGRPNVGQYSYLRNWLYLLQRITGVLAFAFIIYHTVTMRFIVKTTTAEGVTAQLGSTLIVAVYVIGATATIFHFTNGLWNIFIKWGITIGPRTQRLSLCLFAFMGIALLAVTLLALFSFLPMEKLPLGT